MAFNVLPHGAVRIFLPFSYVCHTLFHMVTFGHKCRLICVQYIDNNGQYNKCHKVSCFTQDKLT